MQTLSEISFEYPFSSSQRLLTAIKYADAFTSLHQNTCNCSLYQRETQLLALQFPHCLQPAEPDDLFAGRIRYELVGLSPEPGGLGYYCAPKLDQALDSDWLDEGTKSKVRKIIDYWKNESTQAKVRAAYPPDLAGKLPSDAWTQESGVAFPLYRMGGTVLNYKKLLNLGLGGLINLLNEKQKETSDPNRIEFYKHGIRALEVMQSSIDFYIRTSTNPSIRKTLQEIRCDKPKHLRQAIQLIWIYALHSGTWNYGRLDSILGTYLSEDLNQGLLTEPEALEMLCSWWKLMHAYANQYNNRVIIGGIGRENETEADRFALLAIEATRKVRLNQPQLTLRFHSKQNPELWNLAITAISEGCTFPMLYNDDINVPAVAASHQVDLEMATNYVPYGCGEYVLGCYAAASPNGVINLLKAVEVATHEGVDPVTGVRVVKNIPPVDQMHGFEALWDAYCQVVQHFVEALARQQRIEYDVVAETCPFLWISLLTEDCIEKGKPAYAGGVRYLSGTIETYGNANAANSLLVFQELVFKRKLVTLRDFVTILDNNFEGENELLQQIKSIKKYGNDEGFADEMAQKVHNHICHLSRNVSAKVGLHSYLVVIINNWANTVLGWKTNASAEGRLAGEPMANGNNPTPGSDVSGVTAFLNSIAKLDPAIHAGAVQNMKFSKDWFGENRPKFEALLKTYFTRGGTQAMITVVSKDDLEAARLEPEKWGHLMVRVGGFSIRFVDLPPEAQQELIDRTLH